MNTADQLTEEQGRYLLDVARKTIDASLSGSQQGKDPKDERPDEIFQKHLGTFVTLTTDGRLRGCIGHIIPHETLLEGIRENALNAAFRDPRFPPLRKEEWARVNIEISILTDPKPLHYKDAADLLARLRPGVDGLIIKKGYHQATFLPQVWEQLPAKEAFLEHLCMKAGLAGDAWKKGDLDVLTYQVQAFEE